MIDTQETLGQVSVADDALQVVFHRHYARPIEKVWAAITTPERLADWLANAEVELKPGGTIRLNWNGIHEMQGRVLVCEAPRAFAWTWELDGRETVVRFDLKSDGDGCWLTLTHSGLSPKAGRGSGVRAGWHAHLDGLPDAIEGRKTAWEVKTAREKVVAGLYPALPA
ncbi:MAG: Activator of Hsp90 ATPase 1 family protein [Phenylobacterium sp.]|jgi:uncharacterized protein YndB with AHSA1/START domain|uniref:SRPBCC family protein n=1 Tax=Phenylobacterium sp. TaxID=1871053 RepID=UPI00260FB779|nr:SRPBCC family protein [Phenylobacterium sp.]MDB5463377.1 Activator of Hsp90 ATPase 1 family protein [Phenylobacterium sp.]MDB5496227.1 Activator of Hsp90 ATPase 1 family protein [Phenylobacterium sp.]